jgi:hypothetical protein
LKKVLIFGIKPELIDFALPEYVSFPGLNAAKVLEGLNAGAASLNSLGYEARLCLTGFGLSAEADLQRELLKVKYDCVLIGAGIRNVASQFLFFERMINVIHEYAPQAKICFNTKPSDTAEAVQRWV